MNLGPRLWSAPAPSWRFGRTVLHEHGLVLTARFGRTPAVRRWDEIADLWYDVTMRIDHDESMGSVTTRITRTLTFDFGDGRPIRARLREDPVRTLARDFFMYGIRERPTSRADEVAARIRERVGAVQLPAVEERLAAGGAVEFGAVSATADGLRYRDETLRWRQISWLGFMHRYSSRPPVDGGGFAVIQYDLGRRSIKVPAAEVANLQTLERLYDSLPRVPERLAVTGDYEPPGGEHSVGTLYLRCPACGVVSADLPSSYSVDDGDYRWPIDLRCQCGHTGRAMRDDVVPRDGEWTCDQRGCDTVFAVPAEASSVVCPVCRRVHRTGR